MYRYYSSSLSLGFGAPRLFCPQSQRGVAEDGIRLSLLQLIPLVSYHRKFLPWQVAAALTAQAMHDVQQQQQKQEQQQQEQQQQEELSPSVVSAVSSLFSLGSVPSFPLVSLSFPLLVDAFGMGSLGGPLEAPPSTPEVAALEGPPASELLLSEGPPEEAPKETEVGFAVVSPSPMSGDLWLVLRENAGLTEASLRALGALEDMGPPQGGPPVVVLNASCFGGPGSPWKGRLASGGGLNINTLTESPTDATAAAAAAGGASPSSSESRRASGAPARAQRKKSSSNNSSNNHGSNSSSTSNSSLLSDESSSPGHGGDGQSPGAPGGPQGPPSDENGGLKPLGLAVRLGVGCGGEAKGCPPQGCKHETTALATLVVILNAIFLEGGA